MKIVVPDDFPSVFTGTPAHRRLLTLGEVEIHTTRGVEEPAELIRRIGDAEIVVNIRSHAPFTGAVFEACPRLRMISVWGTGVDNIDLAAAGRHGVAVANIPGVNADAVAEHTFALILAVARKITEADRELRAGRWSKMRLTQLHGKTLGVFGLGEIGSRVVRLGLAFGMSVLAWTMRPGDGRAEALGARWATRDDLLQNSDVVTIHLRLTEETKGFLGTRELGLMKPTAILVNTARGAIVDREALLACLRAGKIQGAGLDVFHEEPIPPGDPILSLPNAVLSPHHASSTPEVINAGLMRTVENIEQFLAGIPQNVVMPAEVQ